MSTEPVFAGEAAQFRLYLDGRGAFGIVSPELGWLGRVPLDQTDIDALFPGATSGPGDGFEELFTSPIP